MPPVITLSQFVRQVRKIRKHWGLEQHKELWFRGEPKDYGVSALRPGLYHPPLKPIDDLLNTEDKLYSEFSRCAIQLSSEKQADDCWDWDSYIMMQHHDCPTRLLDWTDGALIGALMALRDQACKENAVVWVLEPDRLTKELKKDLGRTRLIQQWSEYYKISRDKGLVDGLSVDDWEEAYLPRAPEDFPEVQLPDSPMLIDTVHITRRIAAQRSRFILLGRDPSWLKCHSEKPDSFIKRIDIDKRAKSQIRVELRDAGISERLIYPDLDGLGRDIRQIWEAQRYF